MSAPGVAPARLPAATTVVGRLMRRPAQSSLGGARLRAAPLERLRRRGTAARAASEEEAGEGAPDWDAEMSIFKKRTLKSSQLATLRQIEGEASLGKVLYAENDLVIVEGLNNDAEPGTVVSFASGARGVLLWRRNDNICFILAFGGASGINEGTPVQCNIQGVLQVIDDEEGAVTKRKYEAAQIPVDGTEGSIVNFIGRVKGSSGHEDKGAKIPLLNKSPNMEDRGQIKESMFTGVAAVDTLAPLGCGQSMLLAGLQGSGKLDLMLEAILGQRRNDVHCVLALIGEEEGAAEKIKAMLEDKGAMAHTTIVEAPKGSSLSQSYLAMCTATSIAEQYRDNCEHSLVLLSDMQPMTELWELFTKALAKMGPKVLALDSGDEEKLEKALEKDDEMVEYAGMLVSASAAQRRQFFAALIQRAAKMHKRLGGGSLTMVGALAGEPATGVLKKRKAVIEQHQTLSAEVKAKLLAALEAQGALAAVDPDADRRLVRTEVVEEFMSLTDGQIVLEGTRDSDTGCPVVKPSATVSRIGNRAYHPALTPVATPIRAAIVQADDAARASIDDNTDEINRALRARALLLQDLEQPVLLEDLVVKLYALQAGCFDKLDPRRVRSAGIMISQECRLKLPEIFKEIRTTSNLSAAGIAKLKEWMSTHDALA